MTDGIGATYGDKPLAFLAATATDLHLCGNRGDFLIPRASIRKLGRSGFYPWFFAGVRIHHSIANFPHELQFKPMGAERREILERLRALGYPVT